MKMRSAFLVLEDGSIFEGASFGYEDVCRGEVVFNTGMTGYQEIISDPSYNGQIIVMTYPHIGNYGVNQKDMEANRCFASGIVVRDYCENYSNFRAETSFGDFLRSQKVVGITGVDTRAITRAIRDTGAMRGMIRMGDAIDDGWIDEVRKIPNISDVDLVSEVIRPISGESISDEKQQASNPHVVVLDFGAKQSIIDQLAASGFKVTIVPGKSSLDEVKALSPDAILLSNGPGDPAQAGLPSEVLDYYLGQLPIFGICLGHQLLAMHLGAKTYKLKFGHHGVNHPVQDLETGRVYITSQNHGYAVDEQSIRSISTSLGKVKVTHRHLSDQTVAGFRLPEAKVLSVQYHPEAGPGPHDARDLFEKFKAMIGRT